MMSLRTDVLIVGAGPAGIAAACAASESGAQVLMLDDNVEPGGQIWRGTAKNSGAHARGWFARLAKCRAQILNGVRALAPIDSNELLAEQNRTPLRVHFAKLIIATGARELLLPFPGWTLPGVAGAGGLQALVQGGVPIRGRRVVVAGSGPLLLAVAAHLRQIGAQIVAIAEQAPLSSLIRFGAGLAAEKLAQAMQLHFRLGGVPRFLNSWPLAAEGDEHLNRVLLETPSGVLRFDCDYLACGFGLIPNTELAQLFGCRLRSGLVAVDGQQRTSVQDVLCAGEPTGIGGLERSLFEGELAGRVAAGASLHNIWSKQRRLNLFSTRLAKAFSLRDELRGMCNPETIVCRCEDVRYGQISQHPDWRSAKLQTRCGMGPCQGRVCGSALAFLNGWGEASQSARPPLYPASVGTLVSVGEKPHV